MRNSLQFRLESVFHLPTVISHPNIRTNKTQIGLIIDDCEDLIPEAIKVLPTADETNDDVSKLLDLDKIVPHLINCVKVLNRKVNQLQAELERLSHSPPYSDV